MILTRLHGLSGIPNQRLELVKQIRPTTKESLLHQSSRSSMVWDQAGSSLIAIL
jgi:hypothetical protein